MFSNQSGRISCFNIISDNKWRHSESQLLLLLLFWALHYLHIPTHTHTHTSGDTFSLNGPHRPRRDAITSASIFYMFSFDLLNIFSVCSVLLFNYFYILEEKKKKTERKQKEKK